MTDLGRVLVVDDDPEVLASLRDELSLSFEVCGADSGEAALRCLESASFDAVVSDVRMPGMGGVALLERVARFDRNMVRVFLTGYADSEVVQSARDSGAYRLRKPWGDELELVLRNAIHQRRSCQQLRGMLDGYLDVFGSPNGEAAGEADVLRLLETSLRKLDWVEEVSVTREPVIGGAPPQPEPIYGGRRGPALLSGHPDRCEVTTLLLGPERAVHRVRVRWRGAGDHARRVVELSLRHAADSLRTGRLIEDARARNRELEAARAHLIWQDRLALVGSAAAGVAHDIRSPLSVLKLNQELLEMEPAARDSQPVLEDNRSAIELIEGVLDSLKSLVIDPPAATHADVAQVVERVRRLLAPQLRDAGVRLRVEVGPGLDVLMGRTELCQVLVNLTTNAIQASCRGACLDILADFDEGQVCVMVRDQGAGVAPGDEERIFEPFHSTKAKGMGLGLYICRQMARRYGGDVRVVRDGRPRGASIELRLPAFAGRCAAIHRPAREGAGALAHPEPGASDRERLRMDPVAPRPS